MLRICPFAMDLNRGLMRLGQEISHQSTTATQSQTQPTDIHETATVEPAVNTLRAAVNIQTEPTIAQRVTGMLIVSYFIIYYYYGDELFDFVCLLGLSLNIQVKSVSLHLMRPPRMTAENSNDNTPTRSAAARPTTSAQTTTSLSAASGTRGVGGMEVLTSWGRGRQSRVGSEVMLESAYSLEMQHLATDIALRQNYIKVDVTLKTFTILDVRPVANQYIFKELLCQSYVAAPVSLSVPSSSASASIRMDASPSAQDPNRTSGLSRLSRSVQQGTVKDRDAPSTSTHTPQSQPSNNTASDVQDENTGLLKLTYEEIITLTQVNDANTTSKPLSPRYSPRQRQSSIASQPPASRHSTRSVDISLRNITSFVYIDSILDLTALATKELEAAGKLLECFNVIDDSVASEPASQTNNSNSNKKSSHMNKSQHPRHNTFEETEDEKELMSSPTSTRTRAKSSISDTLNSHIDALRCLVSSPTPGTDALAHSRHADDSAVARGRALSTATSTAGGSDAQSGSPVSTTISGGGLEKEQVKNTSCFTVRVAISNPRFVLLEEPTQQDSKALVSDCCYDDIYSYLITYAFITDMMLLNTFRSVLSRYY